MGIRNRDDNMAATVNQDTTGHVTVASAGHLRPIGRVRIMREIALFAGLYVIYTAARWLVHRHLSTALSNAHWVISVEHNAHVGIEGSVQRALHFEPASWLLSNVYLAAQLVVPVIVLVYTYMRARPIYIALRNTIIAIWLIAIPVFALFPVAPPRMAGIGLGEAASSGSAIGLTGHSTIFYNPYAAVPSLHVGVALAVSLALAAAARRRWLKLLALLWAPLVTLAVIATGNHYVFDVVTGALTAGVGYALGRWVTSLVNAPRRPSRRSLDQVQHRPASLAHTDKLLDAAYQDVSRMLHDGPELSSRGDKNASTIDDDRADARWLGRLSERRTPTRALPRNRRALAGLALPDEPHGSLDLSPAPVVVVGSDGPSDWSHQSD
jgi:membrane-associated phospholipid phosphatase